MKEYKEKWNKYKKGKVKWINSRREHPSRKRFVDFVKHNHPESNILEIGGGKLIEAKMVSDFLQKVQYNVVDISDFFLENCKKIKNIKAHKGDMTNLPFHNKEFDLVYLSSVLEHSPDIIKTISEISRVSHSFYFSLFKWNMKKGNLKSEYQSKKKYFSTSFNIDALFELIGKYGDIKESVICFEDGSGEEDFSRYRKEFNLDNHRTSDYLIISGLWNCD